jgi:hypothetical protein
MAYTAYRKYILIDHTNNRHIFINNTSELNAWFAAFNVNMTTIPATNGVPNSLVLLDVRTGEVVPIQLVIDAAAIVIS